MISMCHLDFASQSSIQVASRGRMLFLIDGLDEITGVSQLASLAPK